MTVAYFPSASAIKPFMVVGGIILATVDPAQRQDQPQACH